MRLIDADALLERAVPHGWSTPLWVSDIVIEDAPTINVEPRWIPFTERWPKAFEYCLFTTVTGEVVYHYWDGAVSKYTAWMPLPKPYKRSEDESDNQI